jgi:S-adenosyl-L-methionine hydrolase (adenosine-forming)
MAPNGIITFLSDFGLQDGYVAIVKGVILRINPASVIVDITHQIPSGSILHAASVLQETQPFFPQGTVHLAVVDPGVGTTRRPIAVQADSHFFVGPDNGLFSPFITRSPSSSIVLLKEKRYFLPDISNTFHGRDMFAPVAAHLSSGIPLDALGPPVNDPVVLTLPDPQVGDDVLSGTVVRIDHFGNLITNISEKTLQKFLCNGDPVIRIGELTIHGISSAYGETARGGIVALIGSAGFLEIAVNLGRACELDEIKAQNASGITAVAVFRDTDS